MSWNNCNDCDDKDDEILSLGFKVNDLEADIQELKSDNEILTREKEEWRSEYYEAVKYDQDRITELENTIKKLQENTQNNDRLNISNITCLRCNVLIGPMTDEDFKDHRIWCEINRKEEK